jgi:TRAP-type transport system periplasmic protein
MYRRIARRDMLAAFGGLTATLGGVATCKAADTYTLRLSVPEAADSVFGLAALHFAAEVQRSSNGQLKVDVFPNGQLTKQDAAPEALISGVLDLSIVATGFLVQLLPRFQVFDLPFLVRDLAAGFRIFDGPIGQEFFADLEPKGIVGLTWGSGGFKELETTSKPVLMPENMKGLRIRCQNSPVFIATYQALGAVPVPLDVNEAFMALSQHVVDGLDINLQSFTTFKMYTVVKQVAMANHFLSVIPLLGSKRKIDALPPALQRILRAEGKALVPYWRSINDRETAKSVTFLKSNGVNFTQIEYPAFRAAMEPVYATFQSKLGSDLIERVKRASR